MKTFTEIKKFVDNADFVDSRNSALRNFNFQIIDQPISSIVKKLIGIPYCYTLQSCYGHFLYTNNTDPTNCNPLPKDPLHVDIEYRISYVALCLQNNKKGRELFKLFKEFELMKPNLIQFGCADWFWERHVNSYVIQIEPERFKYVDHCVIQYDEACEIEKVKTVFWKRLKEQI